MQQLSMFEKQSSNDYLWNMRDLEQVNKNNKTVFSCFSGGGGSTMGYKLAGFNVLGNVEIDSTMNKNYVLNNKPKFNFEMDIRDFNKIPNEQLPQELFSLDILDGSPPCTTFSLCGKREKSWGVEKSYCEGKVKQTLDDLLFHFINTVEKLKPKVVVMENVEGLVKGNAWAYVQKIYDKFDKINYKLNHFIVKGENMGVPQQRHRVFFIAHKKELLFNDLKLNFDYEPILFKQIKTPNGTAFRDGKIKFLANNVNFGDRCLEDVNKRMFNKSAFFNDVIVYDEKVAPTITAKCNAIRYDTREFYSKQDVITISTFPQDYKFINNSLSAICYVCGMSVPPVMIKRVATEIYNQWLSGGGY